MVAPNSEFKRVVLMLLDASPYKSQRELATAINVTPQHLNAVLNSRHDPGRDLLERLAAALGTRLATLAEAFEKGESAEPVVIEGDLVSVPLLVVERTPGGLEMQAKRVKPYLAFQNDWIRHKGQLSQMELRLASGMHPEIPDGSLVLIDTDKRALEIGRIFLISFNGKQMLRRMTIEQNKPILWSGAGERTVVEPDDDLDLLGLARWYGSEI